VRPRDAFVVRWVDFEADAPELGAAAKERLVAPGVLLAVTMRRDGTPRVSPIEPLILDGDLLLSMMWRSRKAADLARDNRILLHNIVTSPQDPRGEIKLRGLAVAVDDAELRGRYREVVASELGWRPEEPYFHLFRIDVREVTFIRYLAPGGDQHVARWPSRTEYLRRATSATSVGDPEPISDLFGRPEEPG